jgi:uncharacterized protein YbcI
MKRSLAIKKLERVLSKKIKDLYRTRLNQEVTNINYHLFDRTAIVMMEGILTPVEQFLDEADRQELAKQVRDVIDDVIYAEIKKFIEEAIDVTVVDLLSDTTIDGNLTGAIAIFEIKPQSSDNND